MRPRINTIRYKDWTHQDGSTTRGIAMYHKTQRVAQLTAAEAFILDYLKQQEACEAKAGDVIKAGRAEGFTDNQIKNARKRCKNPRIKSGSPVVGAGWIWSIEEDLPPQGVTQDPKESQGVKESHVTPTDTLEETSPKESQGVMHLEDDTLDTLDTLDGDHCRCGAELTPFLKDNYGMCFNCASDKETV